VFPLEPVDAAYGGEVARRYRYRDGGGEIGLISSVTAAFCGGCTRARLSAKGELFTCLFSARGSSLKTLLREEGEEAVAACIRAVWGARDDRYSEERVAAADSADTGEKVEMYHIGG
jgi:cyclic pyranopterin phosphate synthase